jgi:carbonic anhydrase
MRFVPAALTATLFLTALSASAQCPVSYSYCGFAGPAEWKNNWPVCGNAATQSPIALDRVTTRDGKAPVLHYHPSNVTVTNSGHDFRAVVKDNINLADFPGAKPGAFQLQNFHFHTPNEHTRAGVKYAGELHLVHGESADTAHKTGAHVVVAIFLTEVRADNPKLDAFFNALPLGLCKTKDATFDPNNLLATAKGQYFTYNGSLTTPPCDTGVVFYIYPQPIEIGTNQLRKLQAYGDNHRPSQGTRPVELVTPK